MKCGTWGIGETLPSERRRHQYSIFDRARSRELPDHSLYIVTKRLIKASIEQWDGPSYDMLEEVYNILAREVNEMIDVHFHPYQYGGLYQRVK